MTPVARLVFFPELFCWAGKSCVVHTKERVAFMCSARIAPDIEAGQGREDNAGGGNARSSHRPTGTHFDGSRGEMHAASNGGREDASIPSQTQQTLDAMGAGWDGAENEEWWGLQQPSATQLDGYSAEASFGTRSSIQIAPSFQEKWKDQYRMVVHPSRPPSPPYCIKFLSLTQHLTLSAVLTGKLCAWHDSGPEYWFCNLHARALHARFPDGQRMGGTVGRNHMDISGKLEHNLKIYRNAATALLHILQKLIQIQFRCRARCHSPGSWAASSRCCLRSTFTSPASDPSVPVTTKLCVQAGSVSCT